MTKVLETVMRLAAEETVAAHYREITPAHLLIALSRLSSMEETDGVASAESSAVREELERLGIEPKRFRRRLRGLLGSGGAKICDGAIHRSPSCKAIFALAEQAAQSSNAPLAVRHLVLAAFVMLGAEGLAHAPASRAEEASHAPSLGELTRTLRRLRTDLLDRVYGQDLAVQQFIEGLFNVEVVRDADTARRKPAGLFVFAGPPGVGKTFLAELASSTLDRPFMRFDMSGFAHGHEIDGLIGSPAVYKGAQPGALTEFVKKYPNAVLLFDEIEKAHRSIVHLFLQLLDAGRLQDKHTEEQIAFRDTIVIFTTNVGRTLYDNENRAGVHQTNAAFHRNTILDTLRSERDPRTDEPHFPAAICSRMATGYPILFNHLRVPELTRVAESELRRVGSLLEHQHGQRFSFAEEIPLAIVIREGARVDARTVNAQAEAFLKDEVFKACALFAEDRVDDALASIEEISVEIDRQHAGDVAERIFSNRRTSVVLFVGDELVGRFHEKAITEVEWCLATSGDQAFDVLTKHDVDFVLLDLSLREEASLPSGDGTFFDVTAPVTDGRTFVAFDHSPLAARRFATGQRMLEQLHARMPELPVFLFSLEDRVNPGGLDEELFRACVRAGGARGVVCASHDGEVEGGSSDQVASLRAEIGAIAKRLRMEKMASELGRQNQVATFETAPAIDDDGQLLRLRCRNFRLIRTPRSEDASALVSDVERPTVGFDQVVGATGAKEALALIGDWLRDPKKYAAAGVNPPKGVLLTGPPGTGKTMLARALASESECAFLSETATSFVTMWQGSGPESVRTLFARARRYAPSIVFIDEIDAVGRKRRGASGSGQGEEMALNALLTEMDGFSQDPKRPVIVIAATNLVDILDPALLRRFSRVIEVELPTRPQRETYLKTRLAAKVSHAVTDQMIDRLAGQGLGMSIADLERVLAQASILALGNEGIIDDTVLSEAFEGIKYGEAKSGLDPLRTARHEAGHALIACLSGELPIYVTIVGRGDFGGYAAFDDRDVLGSQTRIDLENNICRALGGREAERLYYADGAGDSTGPSSDLKQATMIAEAMVYEFGMSEEIGFVRIDRDRVLTGELADRCHAAVRGIIHEQSERTRQLFVDHRDTLDRISDALVESDRLLKHELLDLLSPDERRVAERENV